VKGLEIRFKSGRGCGGWCGGCVAGADPWVLLPRQGPGLMCGILAIFCSADPELELRKKLIYCAQK
jgi:hypothetical protein